MFFFLILSFSLSIHALETNEPASKTVPISVSVEQMDSDHGECDIDSQCTVDGDSKPDCGYRCFGNTPAHYFKYDFYGQQFQIYGSKNTDLGDIKIYIDTNEPITISTEGPEQKRTLLYTSTVLNYGKHTIKVDNGETNTKYGIYKFAYWPSIKALRMNFTDEKLGGAGNWQRRSDGIGSIIGYANVKDATALSTISCSRLWVYGAKDPEYGLIHLEVTKNTQQIHTQTYNETDEKRIEGFLLYDSDEKPFSSYKLTITNPNEKEPMIIALSYIFYDYDPPTQSPAPYPTPTIVPITADAFNGKEYHDYIPCGFPTFPASSAPIVPAIKGCKFYNIAASGNFIGGVFGHEIEFSDNLFEYSEGVDSTTICYFSLNTNFTVKNCQFIGFKNVKLAGQGLVFSFNQKIQITFDTCTFKNIGYSDEHFIFKLNGPESKLVMNYCTFYNDNEGSKITNVETGDLTFDHCTFTRPARDMIRGTEAWVTTGKTGLVFTNNIVELCQKQFIMLSRIKKAPIIKNNIFRNIDMTSGYLISIIGLNNALNIELENNTYSHITTKTESSYCGGVSNWFQSFYNNQLRVKYTKCYFYDITNNNEKSPFNQGGALHYGYTTSISNISFTLENCEFKRNSCTHGSGGAVAFNIEHDLNITNCVFEDNHADEYGGAIYFWSRIVKPPTNPDAPDYDGNIKIKSISINNCQFKGNTAGDGHLIYINEDSSLLNTKVDIISNTFTEDAQSYNNYLIVCQIGEVNIEANTFEFTDTSKTCGLVHIAPKEAKNVNIRNSIFPKFQSTHQYCFEIDTKSDNSIVKFEGCQFNNFKTANYVVRSYRGNTQIDSCTFSYDSVSGCGSFYVEDKGLTIKNSNFLKTGAAAVKLVQKDAQSGNNVLIEKCVFDQCTGSSARCFDISSYSTSFTFRDTVFQNHLETGNNGYIVSFNFNNKLTEIVFSNITFKNNRCNSAYGGGSGVFITKVDSVKFLNCKFIENTALKSPNPRVQHPTEATEMNYYSGDGGAIQIGFSDETYNVNVIFDTCEFTSNKAVRHGGAIALQTVKDVTIVKCTFSNNEANFGNEISSQLLEYKNYYSTKTNGRGGSIYINPAFNHINSDPSLHMLSATIDNNQFNNNKAYEGLAIYVQGDDPGTIFVITNNVFRGVQNGRQIGEKAAIFSEIPNIELGDTNTFDQNLPQINIGEPTDTEIDGPDYFEVVNVTSHGRNDYMVKDNSKLIVSVILSYFHDIKSKDDGGALYVVNAGLACNDVTFINCSAEEKRGGAIFIHNTYETTNYGNVLSCNISQCSAKVGGGVFIFSNNDLYKVTVRYCSFIGNKATASKETDELFGGSGAFVVAKRGKVKQNVFIENIGDGNALKLSNQIKSTNIELSKSNKRSGRLIVSSNKFIINDASKGSAIFFTRGSGGPLIEVDDCKFEGKMMNGRHFIEGETLSKESQKLIVRNCKFDGDASEAIELDSDFLSLDLKQNVFDSVHAGIENKSINKAEKKKSALVVVVAAATISVVAIVGFVIFFVKKMNPIDSNDSEMSSDVNDI